MTVPNQRDPDLVQIIDKLQTDLAALQANVVSRWSRVSHLAADPATPADGQDWIRSDTGEWRYRANGVTVALDARYAPVTAAYGVVAKQAGTDLTTSGVTPLAMITAPAFTYLANRLYEFTWTDNVLGSVAGDVFGLDIRDGPGSSTLLVSAAYRWTTLSAAAQCPMTLVFEPVTLVGSHQPVAVVTRLAGTGTFRGGSVRLGSLVCADIGHV